MAQHSPGVDKDAVACRTHGHDYGHSADKPISTCLRCGVVRDRTGSATTFTFPPTET